MIIGKFIGVLLVIIAVVTILALLISLFTIGSMDFLHHEWFSYDSFFYNSSGLPVWVISILTFILIGIPFFFLFALGLRILSNNTKTVGKTAKLTLLGIWLMALLTAIFFGTRQYMMTAYDGSVTVRTELPYSTLDTLRLSIESDKGIVDRLEADQTWETRHSWDREIVIDENDVEKIYSNNIRLNIYPATDSLVYVKTRKRSKGQSRKDARENARLIEHEVVLTDDELQVPGYFLSDIGNRFGDQRVYVDVFLPMNQVVYLEESSRTFLYEVDNIQGVYDNDMAGHHFKMTRDGLDCLDCEDFEINTSAPDSDPESFNMKIDEDGVHIQIQDEDREKAEVRIDENGVLVRSSKDSI
jgi:hypothetical protein